VSIRGNTDVRWLSLAIAVLVIAVVTASAACVARCAGVPCHGETATAKLPPCHNEKPSEAPSGSCKQSVLIAAVDLLTVTKIAAVHAAGIAIPAAEAFLPFPGIESRVAGQSSCPPGSPELRFPVVLRI
jgi:hypothetical protein